MRSARLTLRLEALFHDGIGERALEDARRAVEVGQRRKPGIWHTLVSVQAELGKTADAYASCVLGRI